MATAAQRAHAVAVMDMLHAHQSLVRYPPGDQRSNRDTVSWALTEQQAENLFKTGGTMQFDCSEAAPWCLKCAGLWPFTSPGYTGSHLAMPQQLPHYTDPRDAYAGALVVFGIDTDPTGHHEGIVHTPDHKDGNPLVFEHGTDRLCDIIPLADIVARQTSEGYPGYVLLSIAHL